MLLSVADAHVRNGVLLLRQARIRPPTTTQLRPFNSK